MSEGHYDLIVAGGGPTGSTLASFTAMAGYRVLLLEREEFPRHQIGESLLPATIHGICRMLGVLDEVERRGFPKKNGGTFRWGANPEPWTFRFSRQPNDPFGYAYQVERAVFDQILLDRARELGVDVRERHDVQSVIMENGRAVGVAFADSEGRQHRRVRASSLTRPATGATSHSSSASGSTRNSSVTSRSTATSKTASACRRPTREHPERGVPRRVVLVYPLVRLRSPASARWSRARRRQRSARGRKGSTGLHRALPDHPGLSRRRQAHYGGALRSAADPQGLFLLHDQVLGARHVPRR